MRGWARPVSLIATLLLASSLTRSTSVEMGINPTDVYTVRTDLFGERYNSAEKRQVFYETLRDRMGGLPGVVEVAAGDASPYTESGSGNGLQIGDGDDAIRTNVGWTSVSENFFSVFEMPWVSGRSFAASDSGVAIINEAMARRFWPTSDPLGQPFYKGSAEGTRLRVVGVVGDVKRGSPTAPPSPLVYLPGGLLQRSFVKTAGGDVLAFEARVRGSSGKSILGFLCPSPPWRMRSVARPRSLAFRRS